MHHLYDINKAYAGFIGRFGIEPNGILMREETFQLLKNAMESETTIKVAEDAKITFMGHPIFKSEQMEVGQIRFVI